MDNKIAERIKELRIKQGYKSKQALADALHTSLNNIKGWENEKKPVYPGIDKLFDMCELFGCDLDYLTGRITERTHDIHFIHEYTGLSEKAIEKISRLCTINGKQVASPVARTLSHMIESDGFDDFMETYQNFLVATDRLRNAVIPKSIPYPVDEDGAYIIDESTRSPEGANNTIHPDKVTLRIDDGTRYFMWAVSQAMMRLCEKDFKESNETCKKNSRGDK